MNLQTLMDMNPWWRGKELIEKDYDIEKWKEKKHSWIPKILNEINLKPFALHILLGPRQAGKTTAVKLLIREQLKLRDPRSIFYFNCEALADYKELIDIIETYLEFKADSGIKHALIILDEITLAREWPRAIKFLIDRGKLKNDVVLLTGSSSIAIKGEGELFPGRRGKGKDFILWPLSFREWLRVLEPKLYRKISPIKNFNELKKKATSAIIWLDKLNKALIKYMTYGGFPLGIDAINGNKEEAKQAYLSWIKTAVLKADRDDLIARQIFKAILERMPSALSWEGIAKQIEIKSPKTVSAYVNLFKTMFALVVLYNVDISKKTIKFGKNKKIHLIDPLLLELLEDWCLVKVKSKESILAESLVATHLYRIFPDQIFFWKNGFEIDAVVMENSNLYGFEVKWQERQSKIKSLPQFKDIILLTKKEFSKKPLKIPLSVFLALLDA